MTNRRQFLQTTATFTGALVIPGSLYAAPATNFYFIHADSCTSWPVANPVEWILRNANHPILDRAADCLSKLSVNDADRIVRLVVRRCSLNLLELQPGKVMVHHWGSHQADLKPFFKANGLARPEIEVVLKDRKKEITNKTTGDEFLYGVPIASDFNFELFQSKWEKRFEKEADDCQAVPNTNSGFAWEGLPDGCIPWAAVKSAWRRGGSGVCLNCSGETLLVNFGLRQVGMFNRNSFSDSACLNCLRLFRDESDKNVHAWMLANLNIEVRPDAEMVWGKRLRLDAIS